MSAVPNSKTEGDLMTDGIASIGTIRLKAGALTFRTVDGEAVLLDIERSEYLGLNRSATALLESIKVGATRRSLIALLLERFDVTPDVATRDVELFLEACTRKGWLEP
jgi:Coenzyme PQQ synthesis protein D (PqqD)